MSKKSNAENEQVGLGVAAGVALLASIAATAATWGGAAPTIPAAIGAVGTVAGMGAATYKTGKAIDQASQGNPVNKVGQPVAAPAKTGSLGSMNAPSSPTSPGGSPVQNIGDSTLTSNMPKQTFGDMGGANSVVGLNNAMTSNATTGTPGTTTRGTTVNNTMAPIKTGLTPTGQESTGVGMSNDPLTKSVNDVAAPKTGLSDTQKAVLSNAQDGLNSAAQRLATPVSPVGGTSPPMATPPQLNLTGNAFSPSNGLPMSNNALPIPNPGAMNLSSPMLGYGMSSPPPMAPLSGMSSLPPMAFSDKRVKKDIRIGEENMNKILNNIYRKLVK